MSSSPPRSQANTPKKPETNVQTTRTATDQYNGLTTAAPEGNSQPYALFPPSGTSFPSTSINSVSTTATDSNGLVYPSTHTVTGSSMASVSLGVTLSPPIGHGWPTTNLSLVIVLTYNPFLGT